MLCSLWEEKKEKLALHQTALYTQMVQELLKWNNVSQDRLMLLGKVAFQALKLNQYRPIAQEEVLKTTERVE